MSELKCPKCGNTLKVIDLYAKHDNPEQPYVWYSNSLGCDKCFTLLTAETLQKENFQLKVDKAALTARIGKITAESLMELFSDLYTDFSEGKHGFISETKWIIKEILALLSEEGEA